jgi:uroporphyrinogen-III synthase
VSGHILITRHPSDCHELQSLLDPCGLKLRPYPVLRLSDVHDEEAWKDLLERFPGGAAPAWLVLASPRAPERFAAECRQRGVEWLIGLPTAAIGTGTADAARNAGLRLEVVGPGSGSGLAQQLIRELSERTTMIFACGRDRRPELQHILGEAGHQVLPIVVYKMDATPPRELPPLGPSLDGVVLTSPRAARLYLEGVGGLPLPCQHWALGATTRDAAAAIGIDCRTPREPTIQSLAEELCKN